MSDIKANTHISTSSISRISTIACYINLLVGCQTVFTTASEANSYVFHTLWPRVYSAYAPESLTPVLPPTHASIVER
jgi:hypothetical protein